MEKFPQAYAFLTAAGEVDFIDQSKSIPNIRTCAKALDRLQNMNGTYKTLHEDFRKRMRIAMDCDSDDEVKEAFGDIVRSTLSIGNLSEERRARLRNRLSTLSKYWPIDAVSVLR